jgi:NhaP-type Na+/H+ or K+/H+ antiporter
MVVAGLLIGNYGRSFAMSERTREYLDTFWELVDEFLNALLFVMIGLEVIVLHFSGALLLAVTYVVVCFSIIGQGLTIAPLAARLYPVASGSSSPPRSPPPSRSVSRGKSSVPVLDPGRLRPEGPHRNPAVRK